MKLWVLRHAAVDLPPGRCYGALDVAALASATAQAAQAFAPHPAAGSVVWASPARRTRQLAQALAALRPDLTPAELHPDLREMDFGQWEGQAWNAIPPAALQAWTDDFADHRFGGVDSAQAVVERTAQALAHLRARGVPEAVWITHAGVARALHWLLHGPQRRLRDAQDWPQDAPAMGGWWGLAV